MTDGGGGGSEGTSPGRVRRRRTPEEVERERAEKEARLREREAKQREAQAEKERKRAAAEAAKAERAARKAAEEREKERKRAAAEAEREAKQREAQAEKERRRAAAEAAKAERAARKAAEEREKEARRRAREDEREARRRRREEEDAERRRRAAPPSCARIDEMFAVQDGRSSSGGSSSARSMSSGRVAHVFSEYQAPRGGACFCPAVRADFDTDAWLREIDVGCVRAPDADALAAFMRAAADSRAAQQAQCRAQLALPVGDENADRDAMTDATTTGTQEQEEAQQEEAQKEEERERLLEVLAGAGSAKLLQFAENGRPPWRGRWPGGVSGAVTPQQPLARDPHVDYDYDSGIEWNEESGDEIGSDDEEEDDREEEEEEEEAEMEELEDGDEGADFVVPDGDVSGAEGDEDSAQAVDGQPARKRPRTEGSSGGAGAIAVCGVCFDDSALPDALKQFPVCRLYVDFAPEDTPQHQHQSQQQASGAAAGEEQEQVASQPKDSQDAPAPQPPEQFPEDLVAPLVAFLRSHTGPLGEIAPRFAEEKHSAVAMPVLKAKIRELATYNSHSKAWRVHEQFLPKTQPTIQDLFASGPPSQPKVLP